MIIRSRYDEASNRWFRTQGLPILETKLVHKGTGQGKITEIVKICHEYVSAAFCYYICGRSRLPP